jgi:hypothetical protein
MAYSNYQLNQKINNLYSLLQSVGGNETLADVLANGNTASTNIDMSGNDIVGLDNLTANTIVSGLNTVNGGTSNVIQLNPSFSLTNPHITLTDGTGITNIIDKNGYTTRASNQNITHFINFSDTALTGAGAIQKNSSLSCNPFSGLITATTFSGALNGTANTATNINITDNNTNATFFPVFASGTGSQPSFVDGATTGLTYNPNTSNLTATTFTGSLVGQADRVQVNVNNTNNVYDCVFFTGVGNLARDNAPTNTYSYNPSLGFLTAPFILSSPIYPSGEGTITVTSLTASTLKLTMNNVAGAGITSIQTFTGFTGVFGVAQSIVEYEFTSMPENCEWTIVMRNTTGFTLTMAINASSFFSSGTLLQELSNGSPSPLSGNYFTLNCKRISANRLVISTTQLFG